MQWRDGRAAEGAPLLREYGVKSSIEGSNPSLSATHGPRERIGHLSFTCARSSVGSEYLATNQGVGGSSPSGRARLGLTVWIDSVRSAQKDRPRWIGGFPLRRFRDRAAYADREQRARALYRTEIAPTGVWDGGLDGLVEGEAPLQEHLAEPPRSIREAAKKVELQALVVIEVIADPVAKEHFKEVRHGQSLEFIHDLCSSRSRIVATGGRQRRGGRVVERSRVRVEGISSSSRQGRHVRPPPRRPKATRSPEHAGFI